jgi:hypothetical protein
LLELLDGLMAGGSSASRSTNGYECVLDPATEGSTTATTGTIAGNVEIAGNGRSTVLDSTNWACLEQRTATAMAPPAAGTAMTGLD